MKTERPSDLADVIAALLILAYMVGCPIVIFLLWTGRGNA